EHTGVVAHQRDAAKAVGLEGLDFNRVAWHGGIVGSARRSMPLPMPLILILILILTSGAPPKRRSRRTRPAGRRAWMRGVFRGGRMPPRKIPSAPRTRCAAPGAKAGCAFFAPGFFAQAKKGGSRRHGAKALDLDFSEPAGGRDPPDGWRRRASRGRSPDLRRVVRRGAKSK